jgi:hypothetical protein
MADKKDLIIKGELGVEEITSLNLNDLDVQELERRLELALSSAMGCIVNICLIDVDICVTHCCGADGCGANCGSNCTANCGMACGANCPALCNVNCCTEARDCGEV